MSLRSESLPPTSDDPPVAADISELLTIVEYERLAREIHTTDVRLSGKRTEWSDLLLSKQRDYRQRAAIAIRLGNVGTRTLLLEKVATLLARRKPDPPEEAYRRSRILARNVIDVVLAWLGRDPA